MRKLLMISALAATALSGATVAEAKPHGKHHWSDRRDHDRNWNRHHHRRGYVAYAAPYRSWRYRPAYVGYRLRPLFYSPRYYITDYGFFGLRAPGRHLRWIRYGDDLLLVNIRTGRVVQILPGRYY